MDKRVEKIIRKYANNENLVVTEELDFVDDLGFTSLDFFEMVTAFEIEFHVRAKNRDIQEVETVGDVIEILKKYQAL